ncbi:MAG: hypothetical protein GY851_12890 [bacterium]|nr:hypothetical protein [bacterium]
MSGATGSGAAVAMIAHISNAIKACGSMVRVDERTFSRIVDANPTGLYVVATGGVFSTHYKYLTSYRGLTFHCKTPNKLGFPREAEVITAEKMSIPDL